MNLLSLAMWSYELYKYINQKNSLPPPPKVIKQELDIVGDQAKQELAEIGDEAAQNKDRLIERMEKKADAVEDFFLIKPIRTNPTCTL